jgi:hypothetical protein
MGNATITVKKVWPPFKPDDLKSNIEATTGQRYAAWLTSKDPNAPTHDKFQEGATYEIEYTTFHSKKNNQEYYTIAKAMPAPSPSGMLAGARPQTNGDIARNVVIPRQPTAPADSERMFTCSILNAFIQAGKVELAESDLYAAIQTIHGTYESTFGK